MAHLILGEHPDGLTVRLVHGDGMTLAATLTDNTGAEVDWPAAPSLEFAGPDRDVIATHTATTDGPTAMWTLTRTQVDTIWDGSATRFAGPSTYVRALLPDGDDGSVEYAGKVAWSDGWTAGAEVQVKTFTQPGVPGPAGPAGPPGTGGGADVLTIVNGGTVTLDDTKAEGTLIGYRVKAATAFTGQGGTATLSAGAYTFERTDTGWTYYATTGTSLGDTTAPTPPAILVDNSAPTELAVTYDGGYDAVGVTAYRLRIDAGSWVVKPGTPGIHNFTGLTGGTAHTVDLQAGDVAGNWSASTSWSGSTAPATPTAHGTETFTRANETNIIGLTSTTGGWTWAADSTGITMTAADAIAYTYNNRFINPINGASMAATIDVGTPVVTIAADINATVGRTVLSVAGTSSSDSISVHHKSDGVVQLYRNESAASYSVSGVATIGRAALTYDGANAIYTLDGAVVFTVPVGAVTGTKVGIGSIGSNVSNLWIDNVAWDTP